MPRLAFDVGDLWQDFKTIIKDAYVLWVDPKEAPPTIRHYDIAFKALITKDNKTVGTFVPELYELAKVKGLRAQQEEAQWLKKHPKASAQQKKKQSFYAELYTSEGKAKTPFELSVLPVLYSDDNKKSARGIQKRVEDEFNYRIENGQPLAPTVYKYQIDDYLKNLGLIGLKAGGPRSIKVNLINPAAKTTLIERAAHYMAQRTALILTMIAVLSLTYTTPLLFGATALGVVLAKWCGEEFGAFDLAENLMRDIHSIFSKDFALGDKISLKKTLKTAVLLSALGVAVYGVFFGSMAGLLALPVWQSAAAYITNASVLSALQYGVAGFASTVAALGTLVGGTIAQRFFWGLGIWDKQIDFSKEKAPKAESFKAKLEQKLAKWQHKFENEFSANVANDKTYESGRRQFTALKDLVRHAPAEKVAENENRRTTRSSARKSH